MKFSLLEKFGASLLICAWLIYGSHLIGDALVRAPEAHAVAVAHEEGAPAKKTTPATTEKEVDFATVLASADAAAGEKVFAKCKSCHSIEKGGANKVGPHLWSVVGRPKGHVEDFAYSNALKGLGGEWTYEDLNKFLAAPKDYAPGTKMTFGGLKKVEDRAALIAYLRENGENPPPLPTPQPKAEPAAAATAPAEKTAEEAPKQVAAATAEEPKAAPQAGESGGDLAALLAAADPAEGEKVFKKCKACHTSEQGGANRVGPNLWGIIGRPKAGHEGFSYSSALSGLGGEWTYADLDAYLAKPKDFAPGTKMTFAGLGKPEDRAAVIVYLRTLSDSPKPLP